MGSPVVGNLAANCEPCSRLWPTHLELIVIRTPASWALLAKVLLKRYVDGFVKFYFL